MTRVSTALIALILLVAPLSAQRPTSDWTQWRGVNRDGVAAAPSDAAAWPAQLTQKWKLEVGLGYATPLVVGNRIYQFARKGEREVMMAIDADSGKVLWETGHTAAFTPMSAAAVHGPGPKSTPVFSNGRLYSIGMTGIVTAYDAASEDAAPVEAGRLARGIPAARAAAIWPRSRRSPRPGGPGARGRRGRRPPARSRDAARVGHRAAEEAGRDRLAAAEHGLAHVEEPGVAADEGRSQLDALEGAHPPAVADRGAGDGQAPAVGA